jgi:glycosyltransferase involved in cell wall biosynthesis
MNILFSMHVPPNANAGVAGATFRLADALRRRGHVVDILSFGDVGGGILTQQLLFPWYVASRLVRQKHYDVVDLTSGDGWVYSVLAKLFRRRSRPLIVARSHGLEHTVHDMNVNDARTRGSPLSWKYPIYHGGYRLWECAVSFRQADVALFLNEPDLAVAIGRLGVGREAAAKVRNGVDQAFIDRATVLAAGEPDAARPRNIAFIGSFLPRKGVEYLRPAAIAVMRDHPDVQLGYFGSGVDARTVRAEYPEALRDRIHVTQDYRNDELPGLLGGYGILAFPSLAEGFPLAPVEAMACGLVPVTSAIAGPLEYVVDGQNGLVMPPADAPALEACLRMLLDDEAVWRRLRAAALRTAMQHSWNAIADDLLDIYAAGLRRRRTGNIGRGLVGAL